MDLGISRAGLVGSVLVFAAAQGLVVPEAQAIIIRDDVPDSEYLVADAEYPALVTLFPPDDCAATLFHEAHLLTVAHCAVDLRAGDSLDVNGTPHAVAEITLHPMWTDGDRYDIAVVRLAEAAAGVDPIPMYRGEDELGAEVTLVGRGLTATGLEGEDAASSDGMLRRATNIVSQADEFLLELVFESPGQAGITDLEGIGASGDSGGPVFIVEDGTTYIAGLNAFGDAPNGVGLGEYGGLDYQTRVTTYADWVDGVVDMGEQSSTGSVTSGGGESGSAGSGGTGSGGGQSTGSTGSTGSAETGGTGGAANDNGSSGDGCGCSHGRDAHGWAFLVLALAGLGHRRRRPATIAGRPAG